MNITIPPSRKLEEATRKFWDDYDNKKGRKWQIYLGNKRPKGDEPEIYPEVGIEGLDRPLLHYEIACAQQRPLSDQAWPKIDEDKQKKKVTLAILVGTSFEPLLMAIWAYKPHRLIPLLNTYYGDRNPNGKHITPLEHWDNLKDKIERLPQEALKNNLNLPASIANFVVEDKADHVFDRLHELLKNDLADSQCEVIIDITGAKKTMVAGAYLFAAYTEAKISYVDYDKFEEGIGRPYGYTCRIAKVANPMRDLALKQWQSIAEAYEEYNFGLALNLLDQIPNELKAVLKEKYGQLAQYLEICRQWESGDLHIAGKLAKKLLTEEQVDIQLPATINELAQFWPDLNDPGQWLSLDVLTKPKLLVLHAYDELHRAKWCTGEEGQRGKAPKIQLQCRLAFTKAYALYETLLIGRALNIIQHDGVSATIPKPFNKKIIPSGPTEEKQELLKLMVKNLRRENAIKIFRRENVSVKCRKSTFMGNPISEISLEPIESKWSQVQKHLQGWDKAFDDELNDFRNLTIHTYIPVDENWAKKAIHLAEESLENYIQQWVQFLEIDPNELRELEDEMYTVVRWKNIKKKFGLIFLLD